MNIDYMRSKMVELLWDIIQSGGSRGRLRGLWDPFPPFFNIFSKNYHCFTILGASTPFGGWKSTCNLCRNPSLLFTPDPALIHVFNLYSNPNVLRNAFKQLFHTILESFPSLLDTTLRSRLNLTSQVLLTNPFPSSYKNTYILYCITLLLW